MISISISQAAEAEADFERGAVLCCLLLLAAIAAIVISSFKK